MDFVDQEAYALELLDIPRVAEEIGSKLDDRTFLVPDKACQEDGLPPSLLLLLL